MTASDSSSTHARNRERSGRLDGGRRSELIGFLLGVLGLLILLALVSYHPTDRSFDTASSSWTPVHNWIGPAGAYLSDLLFQGLGWAAVLVPVVLFVAGIRLLVGRLFESPWTKLVGVLLLLGSLASLLKLFPYTPTIRGLLRGSGLLGDVLAAGLVAIFNPTGAAIVAAAVLLTSLFFVTRFSFSSSARFLKKRLGLLQRLAARWNAWQAARERTRLKRRMERERALGKQPIIVERAARRIADSAARAEAKPASSLAPEDALDAPELPHARPAEAPIVRARGLGDDRGAPPSPSSPRIAGRGPRPFKLPSPMLLRPPEDQQGIDEVELKERAGQLISKLAEFGVTGTVTQIHPGPVVTTFEFKPEAGIKYSRITNLVDDLCLAMRAESILIERVAGKSTVGIEVPNLHREIIHLREMVESSEFAASPARLTLPLGKDITGRIKLADLTQMPHLLIAGSTGSGKSVALNSMIVSMLYKATPEEVKFILIDPKRLELSLYEGIPHLFTPIVTEPKVAANVLRHATEEMENRLRKLAQHGVRNIEQYNKLFEPESTLDLFDTEGNEEQPLPYLVIVIDELADLMMVEPQNVEESITRLAQMARAVGIHLLLATQRPSVDVITGLIKANLPSRISFRVASKVDSRTILDSNGAEALLGRGDMLFLPPASARLVRLHGPLVIEKEIHKVVDWWKSQSRPAYHQEFLEPFRDREREGGDEIEEEEAAELDEVYEDAVRVVVESGKASTSLLQRRLRLGYGRAARLLDLMQKDGIISVPDGARPREVLKRPDWLKEVDESLR